MTCGISTHNFEYGGNYVLHWSSFCISWQTLKI